MMLIISIARGGVLFLEELLPDFSLILLDLFLSDAVAEVKGFFLGGLGAII